jgi:hypothetical protein
MSSLKSVFLASAIITVTGASAATLGAQSRPDTSAELSPAHSRVESGMTAGSLRYRGGRAEEAASALIRLRLSHAWSASIEPTVAHATEPATASVTGLTDMPVAVEFEHTFAGLLAPTFDLSFGATLPVGSTTTGFGTGMLGTSFDLGAGLSPLEKLSVYATAGHALSSVAAQSAFNGGASGWGDVGTAFQATERVSLNGGYSTDLGAVDSTYGRGRSVSAGLSYAVAGPFALNLETSRGLSGATPEWSAVIGIGSAFGSLDGARALRTAFGGGRHGLKKSGSSSGRGRGHH